jgi:hypothetical protein
MPKNPDRTTFIDFLKAFTTNWLAAVSGGLSVPFAITALFVSTTYQRILWSLLAISGGMLASYSVWAAKCRDCNRAEADLRDERLRRARPILRGSIDQIYVVVYKEADLTTNRKCAVQLYVKAEVHNESACQTTTRRYDLTVDDIAGLHVAEYLGEVRKTCIQVTAGYQDSAGGVSGREIQYMQDLGSDTATEPVVIGVHREGWLRFKAQDVDPSAIERGTYCLTAIDAFGQANQMCTRKSPPVGAGTLLRYLDG